MAKKAAAPAKKEAAAPAAAAPAKVAKAMTKTQLISHLAEKTELQKKQVTEVLDELMAIAYKEAKKDHGFAFPGLGKLKVQKRPARDGRNPQTGEKIRIKAGKKLKMTFSKVAKEATGVVKAT